MFSPRASTGAIAREPACVGRVHRSAVNADSEQSVEGSYFLPLDPRAGQWSQSPDYRRRYSLAWGASVAVLYLAFPVNTFDGNQ